LYGAKRLGWSQAFAKFVGVPAKPGGHEEDAFDLCDGVRLVSRGLCLVDGAD
jgi:hypothetical protein